MLLSTFDSSDLEPDGETCKLLSCLLKMFDFSDDFLKGDMSGKRGEPASVSMLMLIFILFLKKIIKKIQW